MNNVCAQWQGHAERPRRPDPCSKELELSEAQPRGWGQPAGKAVCRGLGEASPTDSSVQLSLHSESGDSPSTSEREKQGPRNVPSETSDPPQVPKPTHCPRRCSPCQVGKKGLDPPIKNTQLAGCLGSPHHLAPRPPSCVTRNYLPPSEASSTTPSPTQMPEDHRSGCRKTPEASTKACFAPTRGRRLQRLRASCI